MNDRTFRIALALTAAVASLGLILGSWALYVHFSLTREDRAAVQELCAQGTTLRDVVIGGIAVVYAELQDPNVPDATHSADRMFLARFHKDLRAVNFLLNNPNSACQRATP